MQQYNISVILLHESCTHILWINLFEKFYENKSDHGTQKAVLYNVINGNTIIICSWKTTSS